jgi:hypothetical protein
MSDVTRLNDNGTMEPITARQGLVCPHDGCGAQWDNGPELQKHRGVLLIGCPSCLRFVAAAIDDE